MTLTTAGICDPMFLGGETPILHYEALNMPKKENSASQVALHTQTQAGSEHLFLVSPALVPGFSSPSNQSELWLHVLRDH